jgi:hypothetical protein
VVAYPVALQYNERPLGRDVKRRSISSWGFAPSMDCTVSPQS